MKANGKLEYFRDYLKALDIYLYKESINLTTGEYYRLVLEIERVREYVKYLELSFIKEMNVEYELVKV